MNLGAVEQIHVRPDRRDTLSENCLGWVVMKATDDTVRLIWEEVLESDRMCRYYGYLAVRMSLVSNALLVGVVAGSSGAAFSVLSQWPEWITLTANSAAALAGIWLAIQRYPEKAAQSANIRRDIGRLCLAWQDLWADVYDRDNTELKAAWRDLTRRQAVVVERAPSQLPLSQTLARRSRREADRFWTERHGST